MAKYLDLLVTTVQENQRCLKLFRGLHFQHQDAFMEKEE